MQNHHYYQLKSGFKSNHFKNKPSAKIEQDEASKSRSQVDNLQKNLLIQLNMKRKPSENTPGGKMDEGNVSDLEKQK